MKKNVFELLSIAFLVVLAISISIMPVAAAYSEEFVPTGPYEDGRLIIQCDSSSEGESVANSVVIIRDYRDLVSGMMLIETPEGMSVPEAVVLYRNTPGVISADPDYTHQIPPDDTMTPVEMPISLFSVQVTGSTNDPLLNKQWGLSTIDVFDAWDTQKGSSDIVVAVLDTGIDYNHVDLAANMWTNATGKHGYDFVNNDDDPMDDHYHGTHCAGIIGAVGNNGIGISGVAQNVSLMAVKIADNQGHLSDSNIIAGIQYAYNNGADILSMSFGGYEYDLATKTAIENTHLLAICAAGNDHKDASSEPCYPACYDSSNILAVAATDEDDNRASYSNYGVPYIDVAAPGSNITSTIPTNYSPGNLYAAASGTSMATPMVSGIAALILSKNPTLSAEQVKSILMTTVDTYPQLSTVVATSGIVNASKALGSKISPQLSDFTYDLSSATYDKTAKSVTVTTTNQELNGNFTVKYTLNGVEVTPVAAGTYSVNISVSETTNYAAKVLSLGTFTINPKPLTDATVTLSDTEFGYDRADHTVSVTKVNFTDSWNLADSDYDVAGTLTAAAADTYTVTVTGKGNYTENKAVTWSITKATPSADNFTASNSSGIVTFPLNVDFNNSEHTVTVTAADGVYGMGAITVIYMNSTTGQTETPKKVGSYHVNISVGAGANYTAISNLHLGDINVNSKSYTITYETNGGSAIAQESYESGKGTKSLNTSTEKIGYHLDGWYADSALTGTKVTQITAEDYGDKTFYAKWLNNTYTVTFDKNNTLATGSMAAQSFMYGADPVALTANAFSLTGYHFANWTNRTDGTGVFYADKEAVQNLNATNGGIITLYAVWEPNTYTVHFDGNRNTSGSMDDQAFTYDDDAVALTANAFARTGYIFENWTENADGTGAVYADKAAVQNLTAENDGIVTLYAKWTANQTPREFNTDVDEKITLESGDVVSSINVSGTDIESVSFMYDQSVQAPTRSGYHGHKAFGDAFNISVTSGSFTSGKAVIVFNISRNDMAGLLESNVWLAHQKNGVWEYLKVAKIGEDSKNMQFSAETTSFSPFYPVYMVQDAQQTYSSGSTKQTGYTQIIQTVPTTTPTVAPTVAQTQVPVTPTVNPSLKSTTQSTQSSPAPVAGLIAGLGAAALVLSRLRK